MLQRRMNKKLYRAIWWAIVILVVLSFLITMVMPLWGASASQTVATQQGYQVETASLAEADSASAFISGISWVTRPWVGAILVALGLAGLTLEFFTMTLGAAGVLGSASLLVFFAGAFFTGMAGGKELLLFILGMGLLLMEILVFPGVWLAGLAGFACLAAAVIMASGSVLLGAVYLGTAAFAILLTLLCAFKVIDLGEIWRSARKGRRQTREVK